MREKGLRDRGPKAHPKKSDFGTPWVWVLFSGLPIQNRPEPQILETGGSREFASKKAVPDREEPAPDSSPGREI